MSTGANTSVRRRINAIIERPIEKATLRMPKSKKNHSRTPHFINPANKQPISRRVFQQHRPVADGWTAALDPKLSVMRVPLRDAQLGNRGQIWTLPIRGEDSSFVEIGRTEDRSLEHQNPDRA